jgi:ferrochelatase
LIADGVRRVQVVPLFPQFSEAAWQTVVDATTLAAKGRPIELTVLPPFYGDPAFLDALAAQVRSHTTGFDPDRVLLSFHGLPESHIRRCDDSPNGRCLADPSCCDEIDAGNARCYRAQCFATARGIAERLGLPAGGWEVCFQSRLGRSAWIQPFTDDRVKTLAAEGCKRLAVVCPAFVADCLETTEEIGMGVRDMFRDLGGEELRLVPSLNSGEGWVKALAGMLAVGGAGR